MGEGELVVARSIINPLRRLMMSRNRWMSSAAAGLPVSAIAAASQLRRVSPSITTA